MLKQCISRKEVAVEDLIDIGSFHNKLITLGTMSKTVNGHQGFDFVMTVWDHNKERKLEGDTYTLEVPDPNRVFSDDEDSEEDYDIMYLPRTMHMNSCVWGDFLVTAVLLGTRACLQFWDKNFECVKWIFTLKGILDSIKDRKLAHPLCTWGDYLAVGLGPTVQLWSYKFNKQSELESKSKKSTQNVVAAEMEGMYEEETPSPLKIYHHGHIKIPSRCRTMCVFRSMLWTVQQEGNVLGWKLPNVQKPCGQLPPATDLIVWCDYLVAVSPENIIKIYYIDKEVKKMAELVRFDARTKVTRLVIWQKKLCIIGESVVKMMNFGDFACVWASEFSGKKFTGSYAIWKSSLWLQTPESYVGLQVKLPWKFQRLLWVAWMKNQAEECWLAAMPREIIHRIIRIIKGSSLEYVHPNAEIPEQWRFS